MRKRLDTYLSQTSPLIDYYMQRGLLTEIDGNKDVEAVGTEMVKVVQAIA